jgi:hypothetical protein
MLVNPHPPQKLLQLRSVLNVPDYFWYISTHISMRDLPGWLAEELVIHGITSHLVNHISWRAM